MAELNIKVLDKMHNTKSTGTAKQNHVVLVHMMPYEEGDLISIELDQQGIFCEIQLDDAIKPAVVWIQGKNLYYKIPFGEKCSALSPKAFSGNCHVITVRVLEDWELYVKRNLALNPYDGFMNPGIFPHADANVETRDEAVFAARNAIDGIYANTSHGNFPYGSWGINKQDDAQWNLYFGREVQINEMRLTLRSDFPHDNYWEEAEVEFSDGSSEIIKLEKSAGIQIFPIEARKISWLLLKNMKKSSMGSPFPALTQFEVYGCLESEGGK